MEIELIRNQNHNYACIRLTEEQLHAHERSMLLYNHVPCLLPLNMRYVDELLQVEYDTSGMQPLQVFFLYRRLTEKQIVWLIRELRKAQDELLEYMLSPDGLVLEPDYVFVDPSKMRIYFCYQPGMRAHVEENIPALLQYVLDHVDYTDQKAVALAYALYHLEDKTGNILCALEAFIKKTGLHEEKSSSQEKGSGEMSVYKDERPDKQKPQEGFLYRLLHRKGKRALLLEHAAPMEEQQGEEEFFSARSSAEAPEGKRFIL